MKQGIITDVYKQSKRCKQSNMLEPTTDIKKQMKTSKNVKAP